jgi:hypothetical protein
MALARQEMQESNAPSMQLPGSSSGGGMSTGSSSSGGSSGSTATPVVQDLQVGAWSARWLRARACCDVPGPAQR